VKSLRTSGVDASHELAGVWSDAGQTGPAAHAVLLVDAALLPAGARIPRIVRLCHKGVWNLLRRQHARVERLRV